MQAVGLVFLTKLIQASSVYAETSELPIEAATSTNPVSEFLPTVVVILLGLLGIALVVSSSRLSSRSRLRFDSARNLFLSLRFSEAQEARSDNSSHTVRVGHLRDLSLKFASFVSPVSYHRGSHLLLSLDSLPDFPKSRSVASAEVIACRSLGGEPQSFLVEVRFVDLGPDERYPLMDYLRHLSNPARVRPI